MSDNKQNIEQKIETKKLTIKQMELQLKKLEQQQLKAKEKLEKQIEREKEKQQKNQARKLRNKKIYDWGALLPLVFGADEFDKIADNTEIKNCIIGLLLKAKLELQTNGFGLTSDNKLNWLEYYKAQGKRFLDERTNNE